jgi:tetratricopeptide (TPR) repeat protein
LIYLRDLNLPSVALQHFERSMRLGGPEKELRPLSEAAAVAVQRQLALISGRAAGHSGIVTAKHARPVAPNIIRKTGKLLMPARFVQSGVTKLTASQAGLEQKPTQALPLTTQECLKEAQKLIAAGQLKRAEALLKKADKGPAAASEMWQVWTDLGQACFETGLIPMIETAFLEALKYAPDELASHFNAALGHQLNDKYELALAEYLKANHIESNHPKVWCNLGVLYFQMDQYEHAETALRHATTINPEYARAWDNLAATLGAQDKLDDAMVACKRAIELRPDYPEASFKMGIIHFSKLEFADAVTQFQRAALLPALTAYGEAFLAMTYARLEQTASAEQAVMSAVKADPKCELLWMAWNDLGLTLYAAGEYHRASIAYGEATIIKPDEPEAWFNLGVSYHQGGDLKAARGAYQQAVDLNVSLARAWHNLGIVCLQTDDLPGAMKAFRQEVNWDPDNVRAWYDLGVTLEKLGNNEESAIAYAKVDALSQAMPDEQAPDSK